MRPKPAFLPLEKLSQIEHGFLLEKRILSVQMLKHIKSSAVAVWHHQSMSALINEEDHLRLQAIEPGIMIERAFNSVMELDRKLQHYLAIARTSELGYLTSCPTNLGTGMRVSLFCHLPGLALTGQVEQTLEDLVPSGIAIRGFFGESSAFLGNIFQISNQITLGLKEEDILSRISSLYNVIIKTERNARKELLNEAKIEVQDRISRAFGVLSNARTLEFPEFIEMLSDIRLGLDTKNIGGITHRRINQLMMETQPAHLVKKIERQLSEQEINIERANQVRKAFTGTKLLAA
jgi:protein arginine kinase